MSELVPTLAAVAIVALGSLIQGSLGFGLSLFAVPFLLWIDPVFVPGPLLIGSMALTFGMTAREHTAIDLRGVGWATLGRLGGTVIGGLALWALPARELTLAIGGLVLLGVGMSVAGVHTPPTSRILMSAGAVSGFMSTTATIGGPPIALVYQNDRGDRIRSTLASNLFIGGVISLVAIAAVGRLGWPELQASLVLIPGALLGFVASSRVRHFVDRGHARTGVLWISTLGALSLFAKELLG